MLKLLKLPKILSILRWQLKKVARVKKIKIVSFGRDGLSARQRASKKHRRETESIQTAIKTVKFAIPELSVEKSLLKISKRP